MKKVASIIILLVIVLLSLPVVSVRADNTFRYLRDNSGLLSVSEAKSIESKLIKIHKAYDFDLVILTIDSCYTSDIVSHANDYYDKNNYLDNGMIYAICMETREYAVCIQGRAISMFDDSRLDTIEDNAKNHLSKGGYLETFNGCISDVTFYLESGVPDIIRDDNFLLYFEIIVLVISFVIAFIVVSAMKYKMNTVIKQTRANNYTVPNSFNLTKKSDMFLYSNVMKVPIPSNDTSNRDSGNSTHTSSSGGSRSGHF